MGFIFGGSLKRNFSSEINKINFQMKNSVFSPVHIEMKSNSEMAIEGCEQIDEYDENIIKIKAKKMIISVFGKNLQIKCLNPDSLLVYGVICSVEFLT